MERPNTVTLLVIYLVLSSLLSLYSIIMNVVVNKIEFMGYSIGFVDTVKVNPLVGVVYALALFANFATLVFCYKFWNLQKSAMMAAHIAFGLMVLVILSPLVVYSIYTMGFDIVSLVITAVVWWAVWDFITKKKTPDGQMVFN